MLGRGVRFGFVPSSQTLEHTTCKFAWCLSQKTESARKQAVYILSRVVIVQQSQLSIAGTHDENTNNVFVAHQLKDYSL